MYNHVYIYIYTHTGLGCYGGLSELQRNVRRMPSGSATISATKSNLRVCILQGAFLKRNGRCS